VISTFVIMPKGSTVYIHPYVQYYQDDADIKREISE